MQLLKYCLCSKHVQVCWLASSIYPGCSGLQGKVKLVADAVWSKLTGVFVNDVLHVQVRMLSTQNLVTACTRGCMLQPALEAEQIASRQNLLHASHQLQQFMQSHVGV